MDWQLNAQEAANLVASAIDFHFKDTVTRQSEQAQPLLDKLEAGSKEFPGGKEFLTWAVNFDEEEGEEGYRGDEAVTFQNPANTRRAQASWYERHSGMTVTFTELNQAGINVTETTTGSRTKDQANAMATRLNNVLDEKLTDMTNRRRRTRNKMFWRDGSASNKDVPGVKYWVQDAPSSAIVIGGVDQGLNTKWRNRASLSIAANSGNATDQVLVKTLGREYRQLKRFGGNPNYLPAGSDFLDQLENELRARGTYTDAGWAKAGGKLDIGLDDVAFRGMAFQYDPTLDDMGEAKRCYFLEIGGQGLQLMHMSGERDQKHTPARPENRFVLYSSVTWKGGMICRRRNGMGVYGIA